MKKFIANIITGSRIAFCLPLLFIPLSSIWFYIFYLFCGISDMVDGTIARKLHAVSSLGSKLDTIADFVFMAVCGFKLLPVTHLVIWLWIWIAVIAVIKMCNIVLGFLLRKKFVDIHTIFNKITGLLLFFLPLTLPFMETTYSFTAVCIVATIAAIHESYYVIKVNDW